MRKYDFISALAQETAKEVVKNRDEWMKYLTTAARLYKYPFREQLLIYSQRPDATACASIEIWNERMHCWVNKGAKGIALIDEDDAHGKRLKYVFDVSDVHAARRIGRYPELWEVHEEHKDAVINRLEQTYGSTDEKQSFEEKLIEISRRIAADYYEELLPDLKYLTEGSSLDGLDEQNVGIRLRETLADSISFTLLSACGADMEEYKSELAFDFIHEFNSMDTLSVLGDAANFYYKTLLYKKNKKAYNSFIKYLIKEDKKTENKDKRNITRKKIINYVLNNHVTSKAEIAKELNLSMPTVLANVNDLLEKMVLEETGEYASTGGRKAKSIGINKSYCHAMGILITANHIEMVLVNLGDEIIKKDRIRLKFTAELSYCTEVAQKVKTFLEGELAKDTLLGIGVAIPGIIDQKERIVLKSHALGIENYSLRFLEQALEIPVYFENDANAAMLAEKKQKYPNAIYLSLNHTLGGAFCIDGKLFRGQNQKAGEFGHMILVPGGRKCYCGKSGCADAYCAASVLTQDNRQSLDAFMEKIESGDEKNLQTWNEYLDHLAVLISNLRMAYDMDIILGGDVGGVLSDYMIPLGEKVMAYNGFEHDVSYLKNCSYKKEASAVGAAKYFFTKHMVEL